MDDDIRTDFTQSWRRHFCCLQSCVLSLHPPPIHTPKRTAGMRVPREEPLQAPGHPQEPSLERWAPPTRVPSSFACLSVIGQPLAWGLNSWDFLLPLLVPPPPSPSQSPILAAAEYSGCQSHSLGTKRSLSVHTQNHLNASRSCCPRGHLSPAASRQRELPGNTRTRTGVGATPAPNR